MIGDRIRTLREARSWTQAHLADAAGVSLRTIQRLETVHSCSPETLLALASALAVDVRELTRERTAASAASAADSWLWNAPSPARAAWWGGLLALPCILFVGVNLIKHGLGWGAPYDLLAAAGASLGLTIAFDWAAPVLLLGGPLAALAVNLLAQVRPQGRWQGRSIAVTGVQVRFNPYGLAVVLIAGASVAILAAYLVSENIGHMIRAMA